MSLRGGPDENPATDSGPFPFSSSRSRGKLVGSRGAGVTRKDPRRETTNERGDDGLGREGEVYFRTVQVSEKGYRHESRFTFVRCPNYIAHKFPYIAYRVMFPSVATTTPPQSFRKDQPVEERVDSSTAGGDVYGLNRGESGHKESGPTGSSTGSSFGTREGPLRPNPSKICLWSTNATCDSEFLVTRVGRGK